MENIRVNIIFPLKILDVTNGDLHHFLWTLYALKRFWDVIVVFKQLLGYIWIVLTQVFTASVLVLKPQRKVPEVLFVSLLKQLHNQVSMDCLKDISSKTWTKSLLLQFIELFFVFFPQRLYAYVLECSIICIILMNQWKKLTE